MNIDDYRNAPNGDGPQASTWGDKPHRLVYDLCDEVEALRECVQAADRIVGKASVACPGCACMHSSGHEDTCACDHCALTLAYDAARAKVKL